MFEPREPGQTTRSDCFMGRGSPREKSTGSFHRGVSADDNLGGGAVNANEVDA